MLYGIIALASFVLASLSAAPVRAAALRLGVVARRGRRTTPLGGAGVALTTGVVIGVAHGTGLMPLGPRATAVALAGGAVAVLGLAADAGWIRRRWPVAGTAVAAAWAIPYEAMGWAAGAVAVCWITFVATAFLGLDHAEGLAGAVGLATAVGVALCAWSDPGTGFAALMVAMAAALLGLLSRDRPPTRLGLGACGALSAGFVSAAGAVSVGVGHGPASAAGVLFSLAALAVADVVFVALTRHRAGRPLLRSGPDHLAHRLRRLGCTTRGTVVLLGTGALSGVAVAVAVHAGVAGGSAALWVAGGAAAVVLALLPPRRADGRRPRVTPRQRVGSQGAPTFPVRQVRRHGTSQVSTPLRVKNG
ncbi:undecaprenyl/decaprenyl-phosphate alpha-N-acetylglucosaminyl 1-phosphate transferase [Streptomyces sp. WMMC905]|uniref:undecaprenyl/decaprenyl-phosphate alpha-N-acetylglucosaminyl 1-phosphate transferase n=1 Tax=Streptomyces sp. WMMC905 TaxID=3404123 RepID=UPI003B93564E